ncbi:transmembrane protein [Gossypium australe]|uniref:Transmembrane protein n=1 Tax=Gossypium australe TaxID=47621 RepID=A0A5B6VN92_9ROSI|nr:transmembrane protein [Gossypium australe]
MLCFRSNPYALFFLLFFSLFLFGHETGSQALNVQTLNISGYCKSFVFGEREQSEVLAWRKIERRNLAEGSEGDNNSSLILAEKRTYRRDPLNDFHKYTGGWNISNEHYWASVGFTAAPFFVIAAVWFVIFALCLFIICIRHCCCQLNSYGYSRTAYALSLIFLILFTIAAMYQHSFRAKLLRYKISVDSAILPSDVQKGIDDIDRKINSSASTLSHQTADNKEKIQHGLDRMRLALIILAAVMLFLAFLGFCKLYYCSDHCSMILIFSILGLQCLVYTLVILGWILVTGTFILCGVFHLLHNVAGDACVAMDQWVQNPTAHTALDDILPCVDNATAQETLSRSKNVTHQLVNVVNGVINNVFNRNFPPALAPLYFNQSGPLVPVLCNPFHSNLTNRDCALGEVTLHNATEVWKKYICEVSGSGICSTPGRLTPQFYTQMSAAVNVSYGLYRYGPFLVNLQDCTFVRDAFTDISHDYCPDLRRYSQWIYIGLVIVSAAVMLSLIFWVIYARERRHRVYTKQYDGRSEGQYKGR